MSAPRIVTEYWAKPIPVRSFDWLAYYDGDEPDDNGNMPHGSGKTEAEAIADLAENHRRCNTCGVRLSDADTIPCGLPDCGVANV